MIPTLSDPHYKEKLAVIAALQQVIDPELGINIIDLGLVYTISISDQEVVVEMTLSTRSCPMGGIITAHAKLAVEEALPGYVATIQLVWDPPWSADSISDEGKAMLGW